MTKTNSFKITNKLPVWLAIPLAVILAGVVLFFLLGFNPSAAISDSKSLTISHDAYVNIIEEYKESLKDVCEEQIEKAGLKFINCELSETDNGGQIEYTFAAETSNEKLYALGDSIKAALEADETLKVGNYEDTVHDNVSQYATTYIWRAAISAGVALVLAFVYVAIRYRFGMGLAAFFAGLIDLASMLALTVILRIPVTTALATAAIFAVLYSVLISTLSFNKIRALLKSEEYADMPVSEAMEQANAQAYKNVLVLGGVAVVLFAVLAVLGGNAMFSFALPVILGIVASTCSGVLLTPSLVTAFKLRGEKMKEKREENARLQKKAEEELKAQKKKAKKD